MGSTLLPPAVCENCGHSSWIQADVMDEEVDPEVQAEMMAEEEARLLKQEHERELQRIRAEEGEADRMARLLSRGLTRMMRGMTSKAFDTWRQVVRQMAHRRQIMTRILFRMHNRLYAQCFDTWRQRAWSLRVQRVSLARTRARKRIDCLRSCLRAWCEWLRGGQCMAAVLAGAQQYTHEHALRLSFQTLMEHSTHYLAKVHGHAEQNNAREQEHYLSKQQKLLCDFSDFKNLARSLAQVYTPGEAARIAHNAYMPTPPSSRKTSLYLGPFDDTTTNSSSSVPPQPSAPPNKFPPQEIQGRLPPGSSPRVLSPPRTRTPEEAHEFRESWSKKIHQDITLEFAENNYLKKAAKSGGVDTSDTWIPPAGPADAPPGAATQDDPLSTCIGLSWLGDMLPSVLGPNAAAGAQEVKESSATHADNTLHRAWKTHTSRKTRLTSEKLEEHDRRYSVMTTGGDVEGAEGGGNNANQDRRFSTVDHGIGNNLDISSMQNELNTVADSEQSDLGMRRVAVPTCHQGTQTEVEDGDEGPRKAVVLTPFGIYVEAANSTRRPPKSIVRPKTAHPNASRRSNLGSGDELVEPTVAHVYISSGNNNNITPTKRPVSPKDSLSEPTEASFSVHNAGNKNSNRPTSAVSQGSLAENVYYERILGSNLRVGRNSSSQVVGRQNSRDLNNNRVVDTDTGGSRSLFVKRGQTGGVCSPPRKEERPQSARVSSTANPRPQSARGPSLAQAAAIARTSSGAELTRAFGQGRRPCSANPNMRSTTGGEPPTSSEVVRRIYLRTNGAGAEEPAAGVPRRASTKRPVSSSSSKQTSGSGSKAWTHRPQSAVGAACHSKPAKMTRPTSAQKIKTQLEIEESTRHKLWGKMLRSSKDADREAGNNGGSSPTKAVDVNRALFKTSSSIYDIEVSQISNNEVLRGSSKDLKFVGTEAGIVSSQYEQRTAPSARSKSQANSLANDEAYRDRLWKALEPPAPPQLNIPSTIPSEEHLHSQLSVSFAAEDSYSVYPVRPSSGIARRVPNTSRIPNTDAIMRAMEETTQE